MRLVLLGNERLDIAVAELSSWLAERDLNAPAPRESPAASVDGDDAGMRRQEVCYAPIALCSMPVQLRTVLSWTSWENSFAWFPQFPYTMTHAWKHLDASTQGARETPTLTHLCLQYWGT